MQTRGEFAAPPGAAIVRLHGAGPDWLERVPAVPAPHLLTVTTTTPGQRDVTSALLAGRGYRIAGMLRSEAPHVDILVPIMVAQTEADFFRQLLRVADRAFDLRLGPVQAFLGPAIAGHRLR